MQLFKVQTHQTSAALAGKGCFAGFRHSVPRLCAWAVGFGLWGIADCGPIKQAQHTAKVQQPILAFATSLVLRQTVTTPPSMKMRKTTKKGRECSELHQPVAGAAAPGRP